MPLLENPFVFGEVIDDLNFVNRKEELAQLWGCSEGISVVSAMLRKKLTGFPRLT